MRRARAASSPSRPRDRRGRGCRRSSRDFAPRDKRCRRRSAPAARQIPAPARPSSRSAWVTQAPSTSSSPSTLRAAELRQGRDVDQRRRLDDAQIEHRPERLAARDQLRRRPLGIEDAQRILEARAVSHSRKFAAFMRAAFDLPGARCIGARRGRCRSASPANAAAPRRAAPAHR